ncbi:MAG: acetyltransferase [Candidatus Dormibacteria bacterium]|jgi:hypothetical protein
MRPQVAPDDAVERLAWKVREACLRAAREGYEQAGIGGLCAEGRWEMAIDSIRALDLGAIVRGFAQTAKRTRS